jgi:hypothetical protein
MQVVNAGGLPVPNPLDNPAIGSRFVYGYDFGDSWNQELVVEQILSPQN